MRIFLAGATGAIGRPLLAQLLAAGHDVTAITRSPERAAAIERQGATAAVCDALNRDQLLRGVESARPDCVVHQMTAIPQHLHPRKIRTQLAATNRLRTEGTRNLVDAAAAAGAKRFVAQSIAFAYAPGGERLKTEDDPLYDNASASFAPVIDAVRTLEQTVTGNSALEGVILRYGFFYGPGTAYAADGTFAEDVRRRRMPLVGSGRGTFSFLHVHDAAAATVTALDAPPGIYNVVDDEPAPVAQWLPFYADLLGAPPPRRVPRLLARLLTGPYGIYLMCNLPGVSNAKARQQLHWQPNDATWREGFRNLLEIPQREPFPDP